MKTVEHVARPRMKTVFKEIAHKDLTILNEINAAVCCKLTMSLRLWLTAVISLMSWVPALDFPLLSLSLSPF